MISTYALQGVSINGVENSLFVVLDEVDESVAEVVVSIVVVGLVILDFNVGGSVGDSLAVFVLKLRVESRLRTRMENLFYCGILKRVCISISILFP